jgi:hypothetical protein
MLLTLPSKVRRRIQKAVMQHGVLKTAGMCALWPAFFITWKVMERTPFERGRRRAGEAYDREHDVQTVRHRGTEWAADVDSDNWAVGTGYAATPPDTVRRAVEQLPIDPSDFVFIDLGSGKCRVPMVATEYPFKKSIGVEYAPDLHAVAVKNLASFRSDRRRCHELEAHCADAAAWELPREPLVLFFAHPFGGDVLAGFLDNLRQSIEQTPREVYVVYYDPIGLDQWLDAGFAQIGGHDLPRINRFHNRLGKEFVLLRYGPPAAREAAG